MIIYLQHHNYVLKIMENTDAMTVGASDCRNVATETVTAAMKRMSRIAVSSIVFVQ